MATFFTLSADLAFADSDANWSLGAGIGLEVTAPPGLQLTAGTSTTALTETGLTGAAFAERRLTSSLWLTLGAYAAHGDASIPEPYVNIQHNVAFATVNGSFSDYGADIGVRYVLNPGAFVEVSPTLALSTTYQTATISADGFANLTTKQIDIGATAGIVIEHALTKHIFLRMSTSLLTAGDMAQPTKGSIASRSFSAGLAFSPTLSVRFAF